MKKFICLIFAALLITLLFADTIDKNHIHKWKRIDDEHYQCLVCGAVQEASVIFKEPNKFEQSFYNSWQKIKTTTKSVTTKIKKFITHPFVLFYSSNVFTAVTIVSLFFLLERKKKERIKKYGRLTRENYQTDCFLVTATLSIIPFLYVTILFIVLLRNLPVFNILIAIEFGLFASLIGMAVAHFINADAYASYNLDANDPLVVKERMSAKATVIGIVSTTVYTAHKAKKTVKEITDVDNWPQMK